jgi:hypothetical protein
MGIFTDYLQGGGKLIILLWPDAGRGSGGNPLRFIPIFPLAGRPPAGNFSGGCEMGMVAFYAGLIMGILLGAVLTVLLSKIIIREEVPELPPDGEGFYQATTKTVKL